MRSIDDLEAILDLMEKRGITFLEIDGMKVQRDPRALPPPPPDPADLEPQVPGPQSNFTNPDLYPGGEVVSLDDYTKGGE